MAGQQSSFFGQCGENRSAVPSLEASRSNPAYAPNRLLVLEDDPLDMELLRKQLSTNWPSCRIIGVDNEASFKAALQDPNLDLIIADYVLPAFDGLSALLLAKEKCPAIPFLFVSGAIGDETAVECLREGATDYVLKDRLVRLVPAIQRALKDAEESARSKKIEAQLRQSEEQYRDLFSSVDGIVWQAELPSLRFTMVSEQAERLLGYPLRRWLEEPHFWQQHIHPEDRERAIALCSQLGSGATHQNFEYRMMASDGRVIWLRDIVSVRIRSGEAPRIQGIMVDITSRKQAETARRESEVRLEQRNRDLLRKNEEIQKFYHTLSHELKTPLTAVREFISIVKDGLAGPLNQFQSEYLGIGLESCDQLRLCIDDLLDATRLETGKLTLEVKLASPSALVERIVNALRPRAVEKKIALLTEVSPNLMQLPMDEFRISQVITNLLNNAIKYTPSGGVIVINASDAPNCPDLLRISVTDTGCGIPLEEQERIFDRLYQVKAGDAATEQGIGLGLYLCRELVQLHGGSIRVESEPGKGSSFSFVLPKNRNLLHANILVIDDDAALLEMVRQVLAAEKYNVRTARDGVEGLAQLRRQTPDIVMLDLAMPNLNGPATLSEIRKSWGALPIIVHTGFTESELMREAVAFSPFTLLAKPCSPQQLVETVRKVQRSQDTAIWKKNHQGLPKSMAQ